MTRANDRTNRLSMLGNPHETIAFDTRSSNPSRLMSADGWKTTRRAIAMLAAHF